MVAVPSTSRRLLWFIDAILMEERKFRLWSHQLRLDFQDLEKMHAEGVSKEGGCGGSAEMRKDHEGIFARHRKLRRYHHDARSYCQTLLERLESGHYQGADITRELEKLSAFYEGIRADHNLMVKERRKLIAEHRAVLKTETDRPPVR